MEEAQLFLFSALHRPSVFSSRLSVKSHQQPSLCWVRDTHRSECPLREVNPQVAPMAWDGCEVLCLLHF